MDDFVAEILVKVYLTSGKEITHTYPAPKTETELLKFIADITARESSLNPVKRSGGIYVGFLWFEHPMVCYNPDNVAGVEVTTVGGRQLEQLNNALRKAQGKVGFVKD